MTITAFQDTFNYLGNKAPIQSTAELVGVANTDGSRIGSMTGPSGAGGWTYAAASGGIVDTTPVTIKTAAGVGIKNYLTSLQISNSGAGGTEVIVRKGSGGTVLWRGYVGPTNGTLDADFVIPLSSDANQLLEVVLSSAVTVAVRVNAQGYTGA